MLRDFIKLDNLSFFLISGKNIGLFSVVSKWKKGCLIPPLHLKSSLLIHGHHRRIWLHKKKHPTTKQKHLQRGRGDKSRIYWRYITIIGSSVIHRASSPGLPGPLLGLSSYYCLKTSPASGHKPSIFPGSLFDINSLRHFLTWPTMANRQPLWQDAPTKVCGHSWPALGYMVVDNLPKHQCLCSLKRSSPPWQRMHNRLL